MTTPKYADMTADRFITSLLLEPTTHRYETIGSDRVSLTTLVSPHQTDWLIRLNGQIYVHYRYDKRSRNCGGLYPDCRPFLVPGIRSYARVTAFVGKEVESLAASTKTEVQS